MSFQYVQIHYGPCKCFHTYVHRPQRVRGLRVALQKLGFRVDLVPSDFIELCAIEMCGYEIFRCNIKSLEFNLAEPHDSVAQRAVAAVLEACGMMQRACFYMWSRTLIEGQIFKSVQYSPKNYWNLDTDFEPLGRPCADCCRILLASEPEQPDSEKSSDKKREQIVRVVSREGSQVVVGDKGTREIEIRLDKFRNKYAHLLSLFSRFLNNLKQISNIKMNEANKKTNDYS